ncbi:DUF3093 domain-containing protein [Microbacterium invictum]|uniref:DUF3093 domain-containing protein n=1 Tax=Microbacterium invictum TaxID=515415 RepID=A0AA40SMT9_9MICO|nr:MULTISPECIES: DUF3093 domain-containing protein [Microbacterium]MBB4139130.1 hypothetical protein [Microbacterium invictum]
MHNYAAGTRSTVSGYRERLSPSLWLIVSAAVAAPMVALVFVPVDAAIALAAGITAGALIVFGLIAASPVVSLSGGTLRVGRARIDVADLGDAVALTGDAAREARGPGLSRSAWHLLRGGIDGVVRVAVSDSDDPVTEWVFSSRTPDRVVALIARAQRAR